MSVNPLQMPYPKEQPSSSGTKPGTTGKPSGRFAEQLALSSQGRNPADSATTAAAAAELLRLEMMQSAISLGVADGDAPRPSTTSGIIGNILAAFRDNGPVSGGHSPHSADNSIPTTTPKETSVLPSTSETNTDNIIRKAANRYGVDESLIKAVIKAESNFNPKAVSSAGAQGLMQLMPATARGLGVSNSFDPEQNIMAGTRFLRDMLNRYGGDVDAALAAYNWGPGNVDRRSGSLPRETRQYLARVKTYYAEFSG